jgi:acyl carrier protein
MNVADELKKVIVNLGIEESIVDSINPGWPLAGHVLDSLTYADFVVATEEHFGVRILDRYRLRLISLNDFTEYVTEKLSEKCFVS